MKVTDIRVPFALRMGGAAMSKRNKLPAELHSVREAITREKTPRGQCQGEMSAMKDRELGEVTRGTGDWELCAL